MKLKQFALFALLSASTVFFYASVLNAENENGLTDLMLAVKKGDSDAVAALLEAGSEVNAGDDFGMTA